MNIQTKNGEVTVVAVDSRDVGTTIVIVSHKMDKSDSPAGPVVPAKSGVFPLSLTVPLIPLIEIETTDMPAGPQGFLFDLFVGKVANALHNETFGIHLTPDTSAQWGWTG
jgi:hypothetical protein